jgi:hypothetical protein
MGGGRMTAPSHPWSYVSPDRTRSAGWKNGQGPTGSYAATPSSTVCCHGPWPSRDTTDHVVGGVTGSAVRMAG